VIDPRLIGLFGVFCCARAPFLLTQQEQVSVAVIDWPMGESDLLLD